MFDDRASGQPPFEIGDHPLVSVIAESAYPELAASPRVRVVEMGEHLRPLGVRIKFNPASTNSEYAAIAAPGFTIAKAVAMARSTSRPVRGLKNLSGVLTLVHRLRSLIPTPADIRPVDVYDFDDALYIGTRLAHHVTLGRLKAETRRCLHYMRRARIVLAGSQTLADVACQHTKRVEVVPSCVDPTRQPVRQHHDADVVTLGWIGSRTTTHYLSAIVAPLAALHRQGLRLRLIVMGGDHLLQAPWIEYQPWSLEGERDLLTQLDIGVMPLPDDPWTRGKCGYKLLRYFAAGLPAIATPVGVNARLLAGGHGVGAWTDSDWTSAVEGLAADVAARRQIGVAARRFVEREYSYQAWAPRVAALLRGLAG